MKKKLLLRHKILLACAAVSLLLGFLNYLLFQSNIVFFRIIAINPGKIFHIHNDVLRAIMTGYFSDIAWCVALYLTAVFLSERRLLILFSKIIILVLPFITEAAQLLGIMRGTFDWFDVLIYLALLIVFVIFFPILISKK